MILDGIIGRLAADFLKARDIGIELDDFIRQWQERNPEFADDAGRVREAIAEAIAVDNLVPTVAGALTGALAAILNRHSEPGKHSAHHG